MIDKITGQFSQCVDASEFPRMTGKTFVNDTENLSTVETAFSQKCMRKPGFVCRVTDRSLRHDNVNLSLT